MPNYYPGKGEKMVTLFGLPMKRRRVDSRTLMEHLKQAGNERLYSKRHENLNRKIRGRGSKHD